MIADNAKKSKTLWNGRISLERKAQLIAIAQKTLRTQTNVVEWLIDEKYAELFPALPPQSKARHSNKAGGGVRKIIESDTLVERFWESVDKGNPDECWNWQGSTIDSNKRRGYTSAPRGQIHAGRYADNNKQAVEYAYRVSWMIHNGDIPDGMFVCHDCDNSLCVNPKHLFLGTAKDNTEDSKNKGRMYSQTHPATHALKSRSKRTKITPQDADILREYYFAGKGTLKALGEIFDISESMACRIVHNNRYPTRRPELMAGGDQRKAKRTKATASARAN